MRDEGDAHQTPTSSRSRSPGGLVDAQPVADGTADDGRGELCEEVAGRVERGAALRVGELDE